MMTLDHVLIEFHNLDEADLQNWIAASLIRPAGQPGAYRFHEIDIARIRLIMELRDTLEITEPALPTVLSLLDQLYALRRQMRRLNQAVEHTMPEDIRAALRHYLER